MVLSTKKKHNHFRRLCPPYAQNTSLALELCSRATLPACWFTGSGGRHHNRTEDSTLIQSIGFSSAEDSESGSTPSGKDRGRAGSKKEWGDRRSTSPHTQYCLSLSGTLSTPACSLRSTSFSVRSVIFSLSCPLIV